jgi:hypothetical protein
MRALLIVFHDKNIKENFNGRLFFCMLLKRAEVVRDNGRDKILTGTQLCFPFSDFRFRLSLPSVSIMKTNKSISRFESRRYIPLFIFIGTSCLLFRETSVDVSSSLASVLARLDLLSDLLQQQYIVCKKSEPTNESIHITVPR